MRVFLDTNVLVAAAATRGICADVLHAVLTEHELVLGESVLGELRRVLTQKLRTTSEVAEEMDGFLRREAVVISGAPELDIPLRDPDDVPVVAEAVAGQVDFMVTGDRDLLDVAMDLPVTVISPRGFWERLREEGER